MGTDTTGLPVLDPSKAENIQRGTIWAYLGDGKDIGFRYTLTGEGATDPWQFLASRKGYIQADAASVFDGSSTGGWPTHSLTSGRAGGLLCSLSHEGRGSVASPCNAVFEPGVGWVAENEGVSPDIEVRMDARNVAQGRDPQLERAVQKPLDAVARAGVEEVELPPYPRLARRK